MDQVLDDLEAELHARFDDATLTAYADHLQRLGDPRGELIALDLAGVPPDDPRRGELLTAWLGPRVRVWCDDSGWCAGDPQNPAVSFDRGFVEIFIAGSRTDELAAVLESPAGTFLYRFGVADQSDALLWALETLAARPRPWLRDLAVHDEATALLAPGDPIVERALHDALVAATPRLERIDVIGRHLFHALAHPAVREISIVGSDAIGLPDGPAMPNVTAIDVAFDPTEVPPAGTLERLLAPGRFPKLRQLKLWREEPGDRALYPLLHEIAIAPQLTHLKLPSLRSRRDVELVQRAIDAAPGLHVVDVARAYHRYLGVERELRHPSARIRLPQVSPWPPSDTVQRTLALEVDTRQLPAHALIELMESQYAAMPEVARDAWDRVWYAIANLGVTDPGLRMLDDVVELPAVTVHAAFDALDTDDLSIQLLRQQLTQLVEAGSYRPVTLGWR